MSEQIKNINEKQYEKRIQSRQKERKKESKRNAKRGNIHFFVVVSKKNILRKKPKPKTEEGDKKAK